MPVFSAEFRTDNAYAIHEIEAASPESALEQAQQIARDTEHDLLFESYSDIFPVNEIVIFDEADDDVAVWYDEDLRLRLGARALLDAAREVVARWERGDLADAVRHLAAAVATAEGRAP